MDFMEHVTKRYKTRPQVLDVGGNSGKKVEMSFRRHANYSSLDFVKMPPDHGKALARSIVGNIQRCNRHIQPGSFGLVSAINVFEHLLGPAEAAHEMVRLVANGGYIITATPFMWRYHAYPIDAGRYSHTMMRYFFERTGRVRTLFAGYAVMGPMYRGHLPDKSDEIPNDKLRANWLMELVWIDRRVDGTKFDPDSLDHFRKFEGPIANALPESDTL